MTAPRSLRACAVATCACLLLIAAGAEAQQKRLSIEAIYDPEKRVEFSGTPPTDLAWIDDGRYLWVKREGADREWLVVEAATGRTSPLIDTARMEQALAALPGVTPDEASHLARGRQNFILNPARSGALLTIADDLYFYDFGAGRATRLTTSTEAEEEATFSPDGAFVAFVRRHNLYVVDLASQRERAITTDGSEDLLNGKLDWVYQEEIYGRGRFRAYWWSPDSTRLAFLQINEAPVPKYTVIDHIPYRPVLEVGGYPKAGDPNPTVKLGVARVAGGAPRWIDLDAYAPTEFLVVNVDWTPDGAQVVYQVQNREQTWLDLNLADVAGGAPRTVLRETTKAWVNQLGNPAWLKDGSFLWFSERSGFQHVYRYRTDGKQVAQVTSGRWDVQTLHGVDESSGSVYFAGTERSPIGLDLYRVTLDGARLTRLSQAEGTHRARFSPSFTHYIDVWSDITTPPQVRLHTAGGSEVRVIDANPAKALAEYRLSKPELLQVKTRDGFVMEALMIKPPDFDPSRRYPVFQHTYAGPGAPQVVNRWGGQSFLFYQLLAQQGVLVWMCDNRSASGKGVESAWPIYGRLGELELRDIEDGLAWLKRQPYVDGSRIVLEGWSYGGFMTSYALTHSTSFAGGVVGAPVTDWHNYDSIYTERYMKMPQNNREGYAATAPAKKADRLHGRMLLLHGITDDNVHVQNSVQFAYELQKAGKPFEMMVYPRSRHAFSDQRLTAHLRQTIFDFVMRTIGGKDDARTSPTASR
ncbi:MAG: DPP IV N-terminal domain-containing protein [Vicinamibacterales bacterium]